MARARDREARWQLDITTGSAEDLHLRHSWKHLHAGATKVAFVSGIQPMGIGPVLGLIDVDVVAHTLRNDVVEATVSQQHRVGSECWVWPVRFVGPMVVV